MCVNERVRGGGRSSLDLLCKATRAWLFALWVLVAMIAMMLRFSLSAMMRFLFGAHPPRNAKVAPPKLRHIRDQSRCFVSRSQRWHKLGRFWFIYFEKFSSVLEFI